MKVYLLGVSATSKIWRQPGSVKRRDRVEEERITRRSVLD
jgi:hypothetical protein